MVQFCYRSQLDSNEQNVDLKAISLFILVFNWDKIKYCLSHYTDLTKLNFTYEDKN